MYTRVQGQDVHKGTGLGCTQGYRVRMYIRVQGPDVHKGTGSGFGFRF